MLKGERVILTTLFGDLRGSTEWAEVIEPEELVSTLNQFLVQAALKEAEAVIERDRRTLGMVAQMNEEHFGHCTNHGACQNACPKGISVDYIARLNRDLRRAALKAPGS